MAEQPHESHAGRPLKYKSAKKMKEAIEEYFATSKSLTLSGLGLHLGFLSRETFGEYAKRGEFSAIVKEARYRIESAYEGKLNNPACTGAIFALKNMGWSDKQEIASTIEHSGVIRLPAKLEPGAPVEDVQ